MADTITESGTPKTTEVKEEQNVFIDINDAEAHVLNELEQKFTPKEEPKPESEEDPEPDPEKDPDAEPEAEDDPEPEEDPEGDPEPDPEDDPEPEEDPEPEVDPKKGLTKGVQKRIDKAVRKQKEAEERANELEDRVQKLEKGEVKPKSNTVSGQIREAWDQETLDDLEAQSDSAIEFVEDNSEGVTLNQGTDKERDVEKAELNQWRKNARLAKKEIKTRRAFLKEKDQFDLQVDQAFPAVAENGTELHTAANEVFKEIPGIKNHPKGKLLAIHLLRGQEIWLNELEEAKNPKKKAAKKKAEKKAPNLPTSADPNLKKTTKSTPSDELMQRIAEGDESAELELLEQKFR